MKKRKPGILATFLSICFALFGVALLKECVVDILTGSAVWCIVGSALFFGASMAFGYLGMELGIALGHRRYTPVLRRNALAGALAALLLGGILGAAAQAVYSLDDIPYEVTVDVDTTKEGAKVVLLMDGSWSMVDKRDACADAASRLIDSLGDNNYLQFMAFADNVMDRNRSDLLQLTDANKSALKALVNSADLAGGTNFDIPLQAAIDTLNASYDQDYVPMILMLTDGECPLGDAIVSALSDPSSPIQLYTIRISDGSAPTVETQKLIGLADQDFAVVPAADGSVDTSQVLAAFQAAMATSTTVTEIQHKLGLANNPIVWAVRAEYAFLDIEPGETFYTSLGQLHLWQMAAIVLLYALLFPAAALVYFKRPSSRQLLGHLLLGAVVGVAALVSFPRGSSEANDVLFNIGPRLYALLGLGAFVILEETPDGSGQSAPEQPDVAPSRKGIWRKGKKAPAAAPAEEPKEAERNV